MVDTKDIEPASEVKRNDIFLNMSVLIAHNLIRDSIKASNIINKRNLFILSSSKDETNVDLSI